MKRSTLARSASGGQGPYKQTSVLLTAIFASLVFVPVLPAQDALYRLEDVERIGTESLTEPEDVAIDPEGNIFASCLDGIIYKLTPEGTVSCFVDTGGRPTGLFLSSGGDLLACDTGRQEVLSFSPDGEIRVLADEAGGRPLILPDDLWAGRDGTIYVTDASTYPVAEVMRDLIRGEPLGRLVRITPDGAVEVLQEGLYFPNGVALSPDEAFLYVAETPKRRILRFALKGKALGEKEVFVDELPGFVDGISMDREGNILVAIVSISETARQRVEALPGWLRRMASHLPLSLLPSGASEGMVLRVRMDRTVEVLLADPHGEKIPSVTNVIDAGDCFYMGFFYHSKGIARLPK